MSSDEEYKFNPERKYQGLALVVVNFTSEREGSKKDVDYLEKTFNRLGFKVDLFQDQSKQKFESLLCKYSQDEVLKDYDSFAFAISTHGEEDDSRVDGSNGDIVKHHHVVEMFDREVFDTEKILDYFTPKKCKALIGKPKLFFIQACRNPRSASTYDQFLDPGVTININKVHEEKADKVANSGEPDRCDKEEEDRREGGELDTRIFENIDHQEGRDPSCNIFTHCISTCLHNVCIKEDAVSDTDVDEDNAMMDEKVFPTAPTGKSKSLSVEHEQAEDIPDLAKGDKFQTSNEKVESRDVVNIGGEGLIPVQAPVHITAVPCYNDMLIMFASPQGHAALRSDETGSDMLKFLYDSVEKEYGKGRIVNNRNNFLYVLNDVADKMSSGTFKVNGKVKKNVTCVVHKLSKDLIFSKGEKMQDSEFS